MGFFRKKRRVTFRRPNRDSFLLDTEDGAADRSILDWLFGWWRKRRGVFSRYIAAGGTRETRGDGEETLRRRSWQRFIIVFTMALLLWLLGMFL